MLPGRAILLRRADHVDPAPEDVPTDADTLALAVDDGVLGRGYKLEYSVPGRSRAQLQHVRTGDLDLVHPAHVDVDATCGEINRICYFCFIYKKCSSSMSKFSLNISIKL